MALTNIVQKQRESILKLIKLHLEMSNHLRRDIFDLENVRGFADKIGSPLLLKMLTLMTYADIKAVHPDALTPWKAENLWQLYMSTANFMDRSVDDVRYHAKVDPTLLYRISAMLPGSGSDPEKPIGRFLEGFPQRYLQTRLPEQIRNHFLLAAQLDLDPIQLELRPNRQLVELTVVARDRRRLFADVAGALAAWGMNIVKADAFANEEGIIVDSFQFTDTFRTLELNPTEKDRFLQNVHDVLSEGITATRDQIEQLLANRRQASRNGTVKVEIPTRLEFDNESSTHSTLLQVVAQDTPGLLRQIALTLHSLDCNIEAALIDTEGETAIDVFYLTQYTQKLTPAVQSTLASDLKSSLRAILPAN